MAIELNNDATLYGYLHPTRCKVAELKRSSLLPAYIYMFVYIEKNITCYKVSLTTNWAPYDLTPYDNAKPFMLIVAQ